MRSLTVPPVLGIWIDISLLILVTRHLTDKDNWLAMEATVEVKGSFRCFMWLASHKACLTRRNFSEEDRHYLDVYVHQHGGKKQSCTFLALCSDKEDLVLNFSFVPHTVFRNISSVNSVGGLKEIFEKKFQIQHLLASV